MQETEAAVVGVDLGTSGVRAIAASMDGRVLATASRSLAAAQVVAGDERHEQDPVAWWESTRAALQELGAKLAAAGVPAAAVRGIAIDGTSGTVVFADRDLRPLRAAIMYNDGRAAAEAEALNEMAGDLCTRLGYRFAASYALAKILWVQRHEPRVFAATRHVLHQADYIAAQLLQQPPLTDYSNALKTGYDLIAGAWPPWVSGLGDLGARLPAVVAPGAPLGVAAPRAASACGLPAGLQVIAGATDGTAAVLASGARRVGDYNTTLGTTLVFKALGERLVSHPRGLIYSHKLPGGRWLPGAASNTGSEWIAQQFAGQDVGEMDAAAARRLPVPVPAYPLARKGERFPFLAPAAVGLFPPAELDPESRYAACLQGTACVERLAYETIDAAAGLAGGEVYATGGGSRSDVWMQVRADVTGRTLHRPGCPESAFGSAVLAAAGVSGRDLWETAAAMVRRQASFAPDATRASRYEEVYGRLCAELHRRGWL